ncbi:MAG: hypothetical protein J5772_01960, partial [Clostridia bacterium]|nr:hypothetical protein [Clostridia bacterium]
APTEPPATEEPATEEPATEAPAATEGPEEEPAETDTKRGRAWLIALPAAALIAVGAALLLRKRR